MEYLETPGRAGLVISGPRADLVISLDSFTVIGLVGGAPAQGWGGYVKLGGIGSFLVSYKPLSAS